MQINKQDATGQHEKFASYWQLLLSFWDHTLTSREHKTFPSHLWNHATNLIWPILSIFLHLVTFAKPTFRNYLETRRGDGDKEAEINLDYSNSFKFCLFCASDNRKLNFLFVAIFFISLFKLIHVLGILNFLENEKLGKWQYIEKEKSASVSVANFL